MTSPRREPARRPPLVRSAAAAAMAGAVSALTVALGAPAPSVTAQPARLATAQPARLATAQPARLATAKPARLATAQPARLVTAQPATARPAPAGQRPAVSDRVPSAAGATAQPLLFPGMRGAAVRALQQRLLRLHYWLSGADGIFGDTTEQAVYALQKAAGLVPDGIVGPLTRRALDKGVVPHPRPASGRVVEIDLRKQLLYLLSGGRLVAALNTSTGGGYTYSEGGASLVASTPTGRFHVVRQVDGLDRGPLGDLWRPKYFDGGIALHGYPSVPAVPVSHGCVRVSIAAMNWIWSTGSVPAGTLVWVF